MGMQGSIPIYSTFGLALAVFSAAHWSALAPSSSIRRWHLIEVEDNKTLTRSPIRIDEHILHYLVGVTYTDVRLAHFITPFPPAATDALVPTQSRLVEELVTLWFDLSLLSCQGRVTVKVDPSPTLLSTVIVPA